MPGNHAHIRELTMPDNPAHIRSPRRDRNESGDARMTPSRKTTLLLFVGSILGYSVASILHMHKGISEQPRVDAVSDLPLHIVNQKHEGTKSRVKELERLLEDAGDKKEATPAEEISHSTTTSSATPTKKPLNIVLLYADDWSYKTLGAAGNSFVKTPNLDRLAKTGVMFSHNCVTTSICWQSRATLYTGQYVSRHKAFKIESKEFLAEKRWNSTLYSLLSQNGYHNGFFGKWHHAFPPEGTFKESQFYYGDHWMKGPKMHVTEKNEKDGLRFLQNRPREKPFSLTVSFFATHALDGNPEQYIPMNSSMPLYENEVVPVPANANNASWDNLPYFFDHRNEGRYRWKARYDTPTKFQKMMKNYYRLATEVDTACGKIIDELERQGIMNETLVIFTTDNGNYHGEHQLADKWYAHEESIRVPLIVHDPRMPPSEAGIPNSDYTLNIDLAPTILSAAQIQPPEHMQGEDFSQLYIDPERTKSWRKEFYYEWQSTIFGKFHIPDVEALVRKDYKYIYWPQHKYEQLFHLPTDRLEENDLINVTEKQEIIKSMKVRFLDLKKAAL